MRAFGRLALLAMLLLAALLLAPASSRAQERVAVPNVQSETDGVMAQLLTEALRLAVFDAEDLAASGPMDFDWILRSEIRRESDDEEDRLHVSLRLIPQDEGRDERTLETTMTPDEPLAHLEARARSFLGALFGTALEFREIHGAVFGGAVFGPSSEPPELERAQRSASDLQPILAWSSVGALVLSTAVVVGVHLRVTDIRDAAGLYGTVADETDLDAARIVALGIGWLSLASAITFFLLDATDDEEEPRVSVQASTEGASVGLSGRF